MTPGASLGWGLRRSLSAGPLLRHGTSAGTGVRLCEPKLGHEVQLVVVEAVRHSNAVLDREDVALTQAKVLTRRWHLALLCGEGLGVSANEVALVDRGVAALVLGRGLKGRVGERALERHEVVGDRRATLDAGSLGSLGDGVRRVQPLESIAATGADGARDAVHDLSRLSHDDLLSRLSGITASCAFQAGPAPAAGPTPQAKPH